MREKDEDVDWVDEFLVCEIRSVIVSVSSLDFVGVDWCVFDGVGGGVIVHVLVFDPTMEGDGTENE